MKKRRIMTTNYREDPVYKEALALVNSGPYTKESWLRILQLARENPETLVAMMPEAFCAAADNDNFLGEGFDT